MTSTATAPSSSETETCPSWCTGHGQMKEGELFIHRGPLTEVSFGSLGHPAYSHVQAFGAERGKVFVYARHNDIDAAVVTVSDWSCPPAEAGKLADLLDVLSRATPAQHRELAAAIRKAAADITEADAEPTLHQRRMQAVREGSPAVQDGPYAYLGQDGYMGGGSITQSADLASCGHPRNEDGECDCASWPERAPGA